MVRVASYLSSRPLPRSASAARPPRSSARRRPPSAPSRGWSRGPSRRLPPAREGAVFAEGTLGDRVRAADAWADEHAGDTESLVVTEELLRDAATREQWSVRDVGVAIDASGVHLAATVATIGRATVRAVLVPEVVDGRLRLTVHELDTGGLPALFRPAIEEAIATASDASRWGLRPHVDGVTTQRGCAVVWGRG